VQEEASDKLCFSRRPQNGRRREQKAFKPLQDYLKLFLGHDTRSGFKTSD
jgi:hypothetical protein